MSNFRWKYFIVIFCFSINLYDLQCLVNASNALKDAPKPAKDAKAETKDVASWTIIQQSVTWTHGMELCQTSFNRLATLTTTEKAKELIDAIEGISEAYTEEYDKKYKEVEFGMDRRYWIGLTDLGQNGSWVWAQTEEGDQLEYDDFWYPGQPDHSNKTEHCVALWNPGYYEKEKHSFNDENCDRLHYPICDK